MQKKYAKVNLRGGYYKSAFIVRLFAALLLCLLLACGAMLSLFTLRSNAYSIPEYSHGLVSQEDLYNSATGGFNSTPYTALSEALLGTGKTPKDLVDAALAAGTTGQATQSEVTVKLGGLNWIPTYLSKSISGKPVLTLWLSGAADGAYPTTFGQQILDTNGAFSTFSTGFNPIVESATWDTPANMYGASYIRAVTLNNGGDFVTDIGIDDGNGGRKPNPAIIGLWTTTDAGSNNNPNGFSYEVINWDAQSANATNNKFYEFTKGAISNRILTPSDIAWQRDQKNAVTQVQAIYGTYWNNFNESYDNIDSYKTFVHYGTDNVYSDYQTKPYYGQWKDDKVWLPSYTELGNGDGASANGLWKTSIEQRKTGTGTRGYAQWITYTQNSHFIGYQSFLRTAEFVFGSTASSLGAGVMVVDENGTIVNLGVQTYGTVNTFYTRPCIHLELEYTQAEDTTVEYDGNDWAVDTNLSGGNYYDTTDKIDWFEPMVSTVQFYKDSACTQAVANVYDAGVYYGKVSLNASEISLGRTWSDGSVTDKLFTLTVKKKRIGMLAPNVTDDGDLKNGESIQPNVSGIPYVHDIGKDTAPDFALQYRKAGSGVWSSNKPSVAGSYFVRPYITNASTSNYEIDYSANNCETAFTKNKQSIAVPWFTNSPLASTAPANSITTVEYNGDWQEFDLINDGSAGTLTGVTAGARSNGLQLGSGANKFKAREVGTYTLTVYLADSGANTRWEDFTNTSTTRTITLEIKKKELAVTFDDDTVTSWQMNTRTDIKIKASGVIAGESPQLRVYYTKTKDSVTDAPVDVPSSAIILNGTDIDVTVDLTQFEADCSYDLVVELAENVTANDNYMISTASASSYSFFILKAKITSLTIQWQYNNVKTGIVAVNSVGTQVDYNAQPFTFALDETKLSTGVLVNYTGEYTATDVKAGGAMYTARAEISADTGYELDPSLSTGYTVTYQIKPMLFDLSKLEWEDDPEYNVTNVTMKLKDSPAGTIKDGNSGWLTVTTGSSAQLGFTATNSAMAVSTGGTAYTAGYVLMCDGNHAFAGWTGANAGLNQDGVKLMNNDTTAIISHVWNIKPKQIKTSSLDTDWANSETHYDSTEAQNSFEVPIANVMAADSAFKNVLEVKYYNHIDCDPSQEVQLADIVATPGDIKEYYAKLTVIDSPSTTGNYELYDTMFGMVVPSITKEFSVGDNRPGVPVTFGPKEYAYNGQPQGQVPSIAMQADIRFEIWQIKDGTETMIGTSAADFPTEAGKYRINVYFDEADPDAPNSLKNTFRLDPARFVYEIKPLNLLTDGWTTGSGNAPAAEKVIADTDYLGGSDFSALYDYNIYKVFADGSYDTTPAEKTNLEFDTKYVGILTVKPEFADNVQFDPTAQTEFEFTTGFDPANMPISIPEPVFGATVLPYAGYEQSFVITNWDAIKDHLTMEIDGVAVPNSGEIKMLDVGVKKVTFILRTDENVSWVNEGTIPLEFTLEIAIREMERPALESIVFTGKAEDIYKYLPADYYDWVDVTIIDYSPFVAGTTSVDGDGNYILYRAGDYTVNFHLIDQQNTRWKQAPASGAAHVAALGCVSPLASSATDDFTLALQVKKAVISGEWKDGKFIPANPADEAKYTVKYIDGDGNEVEFGAFEDGKKYRAVATLNGDCANDYEFGAEICEPNDPATTATEFEQTASFADKTLGFLKRYWIWLVISVCALAFAVFAIVYLAKRPSRAAVAAYEEELSEEAEELAEEEEEEEEPEEEPVSEPAVVAAEQDVKSVPAAAKSAEKNGLSDKLDELTAAMKEALASKGSEHSPAPAAPYAYPPAYPYAPPAPAVVYAAQPAAAAAPVATVAAAPVATVATAASAPAASVPADVGAGSLGIGGLPLGLDTALNETSAALGVMGLADEAALHADTVALGLMGGAAVKKNSADALGKLGEPDGDEELVEEPKKKKRRIVVRSEDDYEEVAIPQTAKANASVPSAAAPVQQPNADAQQAAAQQPNAAMGTNGMNPMFNGLMMNGMNPMMNGMGMNGMNPMMNGMGMNGMNPMMNGMGMNGMNPMMNGMGMNGMNPMMNGMGMNGMNPMMNGMGMNGMNPMMNGMGMNPMMFGMGQPLIIPVPVDMGGSDEDTETRVVYEDED